MLVTRLPRQFRSLRAKYKLQFDRKASPTKYKIGEWVMVKFPHEETGKQRKLSRPWHGPYRVVSQDDPELTVVNVYFPEHGQIQIHQSRVTLCPQEFAAGYFW